MAGVVGRPPVAELGDDGCAMGYACLRSSTA